LIYFVSAGKVIRAAIDLEARTVGTRETVIDRPSSQVLAIAGNGRVLVAERPAANGRALVVLQWLRELRQRLPPPITAPR
jgi:hypothetical protein